MVRVKNKNRRGFSLAEAMMATVILAIAAAGVLLPFSSGVSVRTEGVHRTLASKLATDLMAKIVNTSYDQVIPDYNGYTESQGQIRNSSGVIFTDSNYSHFSRDVICEHVYMPQESGLAETNFIRVTVRVYYNGNEIAVVQKLISA